MNLQRARTIVAAALAHRAAAGMKPLRVAVLDAGVQAAGLTAQ